MFTAPLSLAARRKPAAKAFPSVLRAPFMGLAVPACRTGPDNPVHDIPDIEKDAAGRFGLRNGVGVLLGLLAVHAYLGNGELTLIINGEVNSQERVKLAGLCGEVDHLWVAVVAILIKLIGDGLEDTDVLAHFSDCAQFSSSANVVIDFRSIPWRYRNLRTLLVEIGYFVRNSINDQHWAIAGYAQDQFLRYIGTKNSAVLSGATITPGQLAEALAARTEAGAVAERWMFDRERQRLKDHPLRHQITLVSELNVSVGYDIASFNSIGSLNFDRFLEVKSFTGAPSFYWSANEVATAERLSDKYALCLVDRARMADPKYEPLLIFEPLRRLIREPTGHWSVETDVYFLRSIDGSTSSGNVTASV